MNWWILGTVLVILVSASYSAKIGQQEDSDDDCKISSYVTKIGCFNRRTHKRLLNQELINARNPRNPHFKGFLINWFQLKKTVNKLVCECAKAARLLGYKYIGLQNFGECWSGADLDSNSYGKEGRSNYCIQEYFKPCNVDNKEHGCVGYPMVNYMYRVLPSEEVAVPIGQKPGKSAGKPSKEKTKAEVKGEKGGKGKSKGKESKSKGKESKSKEKGGKKGSGKGKSHPHRHGSRKSDGRQRGTTGHSH